MTYKAGLSVFLVLATALSAHAASSPSWVAPTDRLNLRECPSTADCAVRLTLPPGTRLEVLGQDGQWLQVRALASREVGWVHSAYTTVIPSPAGQASNPDGGIAGGIAAFVAKLAPFVLVAAGLFLLGYSGRLVRRGVGMKSALEHVRGELTREGKSINEEKWAAAMRGAKLRIGVPFVLWLGLYVVLYQLLPLKVFLLSLLALLLPAMGYFGFVLVPGFDGLIGDD